MGYTHGRACGDTGRANSLNCPFVFKLWWRGHDWDIISNEDDHNTLYSNDEDYDTFVSWGDDR